MKVKALISRLSECNPEADVQLNAYGGGEALFVLTRAGDDSKVWIEGVTDCDIRSEIRARHEAVKAGRLSELDFYSNLIEIGINCDMMRHEIGEEAADNMREFCEKHGLI